MPQWAPLNVSEKSNKEVIPYANEKKIDSDFGEMLFTHFGVSGPIILSMSRKIALGSEEKQDVILTLDLKPALSEEQLDRRVQRDFEKYLRKQLKNALKN